MSVSHHDQVFVLLQMGAPGEVGGVSILSRTQRLGIGAETQEENLRQLWTCCPLSPRDQGLTTDHTYKVSILVGLHVCKNHFNMHTPSGKMPALSLYPLNGHWLKLPWTPSL